VSALEGTTVIVPARDEAAAIGVVVRELRTLGPDRLIVVDNASRDGTADVARAAGADVVRERRAGYGWACLAGMRAAGDAPLVAFIDGDGSFSAADLASLAALVRAGEADLSLGARPGGAMGWHQRAGNAVTLSLLRGWYGVTTPDIAPLRAIRGDLLRSLQLTGSRYAWLIEMLARTARAGARIASCPVTYRERLGGTSKVSGTARGSVLAGLDFGHALVANRRWSP
jgi:glycosyltransferase involved in cell wall biosynthesis